MRLVFAAVLLFLPFTYAQIANLTTQLLAVECSLLEVNESLLEEGLDGFSLASCSRLLNNELCIKFELEILQTFQDLEYFLSHLSTFVGTRSSSSRVWISAMLRWFTTINSNIEDILSKIATTSLSDSLCTSVKANTSSYLSDIFSALTALSEDDQLSQLLFTPMSDFEQYLDQAVLTRLGIDSSDCFEYRNSLGLVPLDVCMLGSASETVVLPENSEMVTQNVDLGEYISCLNSSGLLLTSATQQSSSIDYYPQQSWTEYEYSEYVEPDPPEVGTSCDTDECISGYYCTSEGVVSAVPTGYYSPADDCDVTACTPQDDMAPVSSGGGTDSCEFVCIEPGMTYFGGSCWMFPFAGGYSPPMCNAYYPCINKPENATYVYEEPPASPHCPFVCNDAGDYRNEDECPVAPRGYYSPAEDNYLYELSYPTTCSELIVAPVTTGESSDNAVSAFRQTDVSVLVLNQTLSTPFLFSAFIKPNSTDGVVFRYESEIIIVLYNSSLFLNTSTSNCSVGIVDENISLYVTKNNATIRTSTGEECSVALAVALSSLPSTTKLYIGGSAGYPSEISVTLANFSLSESNRWNFQLGSALSTVEELDCSEGLCHLEEAENITQFSVTQLESNTSLQYARYLFVNISSFSLQLTPITLNQELEHSSTNVTTGLGELRRYDFGELALIAGLSASSSDASTFKAFIIASNDSEPNSAQSFSHLIASEPVCYSDSLCRPTARVLGSSPIHECPSNFVKISTFCVCQNDMDFDLDSGSCELLSNSSDAPTIAETENQITISGSGTIECWVDDEIWDVSQGYILLSDISEPGVHTIECSATQTGLQTSTSAFYSIILLKQVPTPTLTETCGVSHSTIAVTHAWSTEKPGLLTYVSSDSTLLGCNGTVVTGTLTITEAGTFCFRSCLDNYQPSDILCQTITISQSTALVPTVGPPPIPILDETPTIRRGVNLCFANEVRMSLIEQGWEMPSLENMTQQTCFDTEVGYWTLVWVTEDENGRISKVQTHDFTVIEILSEPTLSWQAGCIFCDECATVTMQSEFDIAFGVDGLPSLTTSTSLPYAASSDQQTDCTAPGCNYVCPICLARPAKIFAIAHNDTGRSSVVSLTIPSIVEVSTLSLFVASASMGLITLLILTFYSLRYKILQNSLHVLSKIVHDGKLNVGLDELTDALGNSTKLEPESEQRSLMLDYAGKSIFYED